MIATPLFLLLAQVPAPALDIGPKLGERLPAFSLPDQEGRLRDFRSLSGPDGLLLLVFRSADW